MSDVIDFGEISGFYADTKHGSVTLQGGSKYRVERQCYVGDAGTFPANGDRVEVTFVGDSDVVRKLRLVSRGWRGLCDDHGEEGARKVLSSKLRAFADQIERGGYPDVYACECEPGLDLCSNNFIERISVTLSHPWPG